MFPIALNDPPTKLGLDNRAVATFSSLPNELMLSIADKLLMSDVNALIRTSSAANSLLTRYMYRRAIVGRPRKGIPYFHRALQRCCLAAARIFVELGVDVNTTHCVSTRGASFDVDPDEYFLWLTSVAAGTIDAQHIPLQIAIRAHGRDDQEPILRLLIEAGADVSTCRNEFRSALETAVSGGAVPLAKLLLDNGTDPNAIVQNGRPLLQVAVIRRHPEIVELLLRAGANVQASDRMGWSALHWAAMHGDDGIVKALLDSGANVHATDRHQNTALLLAVRYHGDRCSAQRVLDRVGPNHDALREYATQTDPPTDWVDIDIITGYAPEMLESLLCARPNERTIDLLLEAGSDIWAKDRDNYSPVLWATFFKE